jgi:glycosyltransferase involved in cell wall biosynthesis
LATGAALTVDPVDEDAIMHGMQRLIEDTDLAEQLRQAGLARAADYTWGRTIETLLHSWRQALA